ALELNYNLLDITAKTIHDQMHVVGKDSASADHQPGALHVIGKATPHRARLNTRELDGRAFQGLLGREALLDVVFVVRYRMCRFRLGRRAVAIEFPGTDEIRPRAARVVGQPEAI